MLHLQAVFDFITTYYTAVIPISFCLLICIDLVAPMLPDTALDNLKLI